MHLTLHLTTACNMRCRYCYSAPPDKGMDMDEGIIDQCIRFATQHFTDNVGIIFFGGEPLLKKDLIKYTVARCKSIEEKETIKRIFHFKVTTNGTLLDADFLQFCKESHMGIGLSIDGTPKAHNSNRCFSDGSGSFSLVEPKLKHITTSQPYANAFMVVTPQNVKEYPASVEYLNRKGFRYLIASLNYGTEWKERDLAALERAYHQLAKIYKRWTLEEKRFYFSPFEMKLATHIRGNEDHCYGCKFGYRQISIAPDGKIYPCVQFVKDGYSNTDFSIGDIWKGFNEKRVSLFQDSEKEKESCRQCPITSRCYHTCSCLNWQTTGTITEVSPLLCRTEKMLVPIVDALGAELYELRAPMFIQKHYNVAYPLLSMLQDEASRL